MFGNWTTYHLTVAAILMVLFGAWVVGAVLGSHKVERVAIGGVIALVALAVLVWLVLGTAPVPQSIIAVGRDLLH